MRETCVEWSFHVELADFRQHSHFVLSQIQFIKCLSLFIEPLLVFLICKHNSLTEWRVVFLIHGVLLIGMVLRLCLQY